MNLIPNLMLLRLFHSVLLVLTCASAYSLSVSVSVWQHSTCGGANGRLFAEADGGLPPYSYSWSDGSTGQELWEALPGTYTVTVYDGTGESASGSATVQSNPYGSIDLPYIEPGCGSYPAHALFSAGLYSDGTPLPNNHWGPGPYGFWLNGTPMEYDNYGNVCDDYRYFWVKMPQGMTGGTVTFMDGNGCEGSFSFYPPSDELQFPEVQFLGIQGACSNVASGFAEIRVPPGNGHLRLRLNREDGTPVGNSCSAYELGNGVFTHTYKNLAPGNYWLVMDNNLYGRAAFTEVCADSVAFAIPDLGDDCTTVSGAVYVDTNGNCAMGSVNSEARVSNTVVKFLPGPFYFNTAENTGAFSGILPNGSYTVHVEHPVLDQSCPVTADLTGGALANVNVGMGAGDPLDLEAQITSGPARPGFEISYTMIWENLTADAPGPITLTLTVDPSLTLVSTGSGGAPAIAGNTYTWTGSGANLSSAFARKKNTVRFLVPADLDLLGSTLAAELTVQATNAEAYLDNNTATVETTITGSYDPNDKLARTSSGGTEVWVNEVDEWIDYTIRFQNTGTDTAFTVVITDTLPPTLDPGTLRWGPMSHNGSVKLTGQGVLVFSFPAIQLPDSNVNELKSHGYVGFRIKPYGGLPLGTLIENVANIYFDFNPPVITEPSILEVVPPPVRLDVRAALGGAYDPVEGLMRDNIRASDLLPWQEPYTSLGYAHSGHGGGETTPPLRFQTAGSEAIVDWVVLELRDAGDPATVLHSSSVLLRRDGKVVATDGRSAVSIHAVEGDYHVALRHRNHLGVMTAEPVSLALEPTIVDLTDGATATWGADARTEVGAIRALWPGDVTFDGRVKYTGPGNDRDRILLDLGGEVPTDTRNGYYGSDVNMDGTVQYTGPDNDRDVILQTIGGGLPTKVVYEQLPE